MSDLKARHDASNRLAAMSELGYGVTLVWQRPERHLEGRIKPVSAFRDDRGRILRHVLYSLTLGNYRRRGRGDHA